MPPAVGPLTDQESILDSLRANGGRITEPRRVVVAAMLAMARHATADDLLSSIRTVHPRFSAASLYRTLHALEEAGAVDCHRIPGGAALYHLAGRPHGHLVCDVCGAVVEVPAGPVTELSGSLDEGYGFVVGEHGVTLTGRCRTCRRADGSA